MRAVIQRVSGASVRVDGALRGQIGRGLLVFLGVGQTDDFQDIEWLAQKIAKLRVFEDDEGRMNRSVGEIGGGIMVISQFTLFGNLKKGSRPSFNRAGAPESAKALYERFILELEKTTGKRIATGVFAALMHIDALNDGPVTLIIDTKNRDF